MPTPSAPSARPPLWTRLFTSLTVANFGVAMIFYMLTSTLSGWALDELGASQTQAGLVGTAWFVGAMVARLVAGRMATTLGERIVVVGSTLAMLLGTLVYPWVGSVALLLVLRFLHGVGFGIAATALTGTALSRVPIERRGEGSGWFSLGLALATGIGPFVGAQLQKGSGQQSVFLAAIACGLVSVVSSLLVARGMSPRERRRERERLTLSDFVEPRVLPVALTVAVCAMPFGAIITLLSPFARSVGLGEASGWYFLVYALVIAISRPVAGMVQDRVGDTAVLVPMMVAMVAGVVLTAVATSGAVLLAGGALLGLGYGTLVPSGQTVALNLVGSARASLGVSSYFLLVDAGTGIGPFVLGALVEPMGYRGALLVGAGCAVAGTLMMGVLHHRMRRRPRERAV
ncbi:MFS transporter [Luteococcus sp.]|uniref:MFS transporter n=1 Tax=Luteococcus sp. TaxID=1969402 RepID=UPI0037353C19